MNSPIFHLDKQAVLCFDINDSQGLRLVCTMCCDWTALLLRVLIHPEILRMFCSSKAVRVPSSSIHKVYILAQVIT